MIVKPAITFLSRASDANLAAIVNAILVGMDDNPNFPTPEPSLPEVAAAWTEFSVALAAAEGNIGLLKSVKNNKRKVMVGLLRRLANYVTAKSSGDLSVLTSSGFPIQKPDRQPQVVPPAPASVTLQQGPRSGELSAVTKRIANAAIYNWRLTTAAEPGVVVQTNQTTAARTTFTGLTPGIVYLATLHALNSAGPGQWSNPVSRMVT